MGLGLLGVLIDHIATLYCVYHETLWFVNQEELFVWKKKRTMTTMKKRKKNTENDVGGDDLLDNGGLSVMTT